MEILNKMPYNRWVLISYSSIERKKLYFKCLSIKKWLKCYLTGYIIHITVLPHIDLVVIYSSLLKRTSDIAYHISRFLEANLMILYPAATLCSILKSLVLVQNALYSLETHTVFFVLIIGIASYFPPKLSVKMLHDITVAILILA